MIKIRRHTFETNSSSMHSLVVMKNGHECTKEEIEEDLYISKDGIYRIWSEEDMMFERYPFDILSTPSDKFRYLIASFSHSEEKRKEIIKAFLGVEKDIKEIEFPKNWDSEEPFYGSIDHQSDGFIANYIDENKISFKEFLFNTKYKIIIDGDEYGIWEKMKEAGLINTNEIDIDINPCDVNYLSEVDKEDLEDFFSDNETR